MRKVRVIIVDGDVGSRRMLGRALEADPSLDLVAASAPGGFAVEKVRQLQPDIVLLGLAPDGPTSLEVLSTLRSSRPDLPVIVAGPSVVRGSPLTLEALTHGASACVPFDPVKSEAFGPALIQKLHACLPRALAPPTASVVSLNGSARVPEPARPTTGIEAVVIGSSTGAPNVLAEVFSALPVDLPVPVLVVQHIDSYFVAPLARRLDSAGPMPVKVASNGDLALPGTAWLSPGNVHMALKRERDRLKIVLDDGPAENSFKPAVDVLFRSAAKALDGSVLAVVLTGMGYDGLRGSREIKATGGHVIVQDEATSVVWGMPGCVAQAGLASKMLPPSEIGPEIVRLLRARGAPPAKADPR